MGTFYFQPVHCDYTVLSVIVFYLWNSVLSTFKTEMHTYALPVFIFDICITIKADMHEVVLSVTIWVLFIFSLYTVVTQYCQYDTNINTNS